MWPLSTNKADLIIAGKSLQQWEEQLGQEFSIQHPWELLDIQTTIFASITEWDGHPAIQMGENARVIVGAGSKILPGVFIEGDIVIGENCKIGPNCYLRGSTSIGNNCHVGQAVELKNSILFPNTNVGHLSYIGDSILGKGVNLGAGTITSNLRHDGKNHISAVEGKLVDTGRRKFGTILGDGVHTGIHTSIYPGRKMGPGTTTLPAEALKKDKA